MHRSPGLFASMARAYMTTHKATEEDLAHVAVKNHENGFMNPKAHVHKKITVDDVLKSPVVASPLKLLDCSRSLMVHLQLFYVVKSLRKRATGHTSK